MADNAADQLGLVVRSPTKSPGQDKARGGLRDWISSAKKVMKHRKFLRGLRLHKKHKKVMVTSTGDTALLGAQISANQSDVAKYLI